jgi:hypothetical protein
VEGEEGEAQVIDNDLCAGVGKDTNAERGPP